MANAAGAVHVDGEDNILHVSFMENTPNHEPEGDGKFQGFIADIYYHLASQMGYELELVSTPIFRVVRDFYSGDSAFMMSPAFIVDMHEGVQRSDEIICITYSFVTTNGNIVDNVDDLAGKRVGFGLASHFIDGYAAYLAGNETPMVPVKTLSGIEAMRMLAYGRLDVAFLPTFFIKPILDADTTKTGIPEELKAGFDTPVVAEKANFRMHLHPNSPLYPRREEFFEIVSQGVEGGVFMDILRKHEDDIDAFCDLSLP